MPIEHINKTDTLNEGREKINEAIDGANAADVTSKAADTKATQALANSESTQTQLDTIVIDGDSSVEAAQARVDEKGVSHPTLKARIDDGMNSVNQQLAESTKEISTNIGVFGWWVPPKQPSYNSDDGYDDSIPGVFPMNQIDYPYESIIEHAWDKFVNDDDLTDYVTKQNLGKDQSDTHNIYRYIFTPGNYEKTIILLSGLHGWEMAGAGALSRLMHHVCYDWDKNPQLAYLRHKVRIVILPFQNPWGYVNRSRLNSRGVDLNRNFDFNWSRYVVTNPEYDYKGSSAFSEAESQYVRDTLNEFNDSIALLDFHQQSYTTSNSYHFIIYEPSIRFSSGELLREIKAGFSDLNLVIGQSAGSPTATNFSSKYDMFGCTPEFVAQAFDYSKPFNSEEMTKFVEFAGNLVIKSVGLEKPSTRVKPFVTNFRNAWTGANPLVAPVSTEFTELDLPTYSFESPGKGVLIVNTQIIYKNTEQGTYNYFAPLLGQDGNYYRRSNTVSNWNVYKSTMVADARDVVNMTSSIPVNQAGNCHVGLFARSNGGELGILGFAANILFIPSDGDKRQRSLFLGQSSGEYYDESGFPFYDF